MNQFCTKCNKCKPLNEFAKSSRERRGYTKRCLECKRVEYTKVEHRSGLNHKLAKKRYNDEGLRSCVTCKEFLPVEQFSKDKSALDGLSINCRNCKKIADDSYRSNNSEKVKVSRKKSALKIRLKAMEPYGVFCHCCGEKEKCFLSFDHINGEGTKHRREVGSGTPFYLWVIKNNWPDFLTILCHNCNMAKGFYGECPHKLTKESNRGK
jgi:hypothetical protein